MDFPACASPVGWGEPGASQEIPEDLPGVVTLSQSIPRVEHVGFGEDPVDLGEIQWILGRIQWILGGNPVDFGDDPVDFGGGSRGFWGEPSGFWGRIQWILEGTQRI